MQHVSPLSSLSPLWAPQAHHLLMQPPLLFMPHLLCTHHGRSSLLWRQTCTFLYSGHHPLHTASLGLQLVIWPHTHHTSHSLATHLLGAPHSTHLTPLAQWHISEYCYTLPLIFFSPLSHLLSALPPHTSLSRFPSHTRLHTTPRGRRLSGGRILTHTVVCMAFHSCILCMPQGMHTPLSLQVLLSPCPCHLGLSVHALCTHLSASLPGHMGALSICICTPFSLSAWTHTHSSFLYTQISHLSSVCTHTGVHWLHLSSWPLSGMARISTHTLHLPHMPPSCLTPLSGPTPLLRPLSDSGRDFHLSPQGRDVPDRAFVPFQSHLGPGLPPHALGTTPVG